MTRFNKITDLLCFKGKIDNKHFILNEFKGRENNNDFIIILSIFK